ncbi:hypothetical protein Taro_032066 [Colocasia esculenta]|uniref:Secreted protein n=1 Tax=Colocasia esculenta TaxID=4460 RepID=A0A843VWB2_COLES|nr:hypothetical protein [Colocasia esculenta]
MPRPVVFWVPEAKSLGRFPPFPLLVPFLLSLLLSKGESFPLSGGSCVVAQAARGGVGVAARSEEVALSPCSPPHDCDVCCVWATPGCGIPPVCLPADAATIERVANIRGGVAPVGRDLIAALVAVAIRVVSRLGYPLRQGCRDLVCNRNKS